MTDFENATPSALIARTDIIAIIDRHIANRKRDLADERKRGEDTTSTLDALVGLEDLRAELLGSAAPEIPDAS